MVFVSAFLWVAGSFGHDLVVVFAPVLVLYLAGTTLWSFSRLPQLEEKAVRG
jgi:hypothetical protein